MKMKTPNVFFGSNIKFLRTRTGKSQEEAAADLGISRSKLKSYENGIAINPPLELLNTLSEYFRFSIDMLVNSDLSKITEFSLRQIEGDYSDYAKGTRIRILATTVDKRNRDNIELVPVKSKAGYAAGYRDPEYVGQLPVFHLPFLHRERKYRAFQLEGDSMLPIPDRAYVVGEYVEDWHQVKTGQACVILTRDEGIVFKILQNRLHSGRRWVLASLNPQYEPYTIHVSQIQEVWKFVNYFSQELPAGNSMLQEASQELRAIADRIARG
jgi:transcriptional regulator with XRE-family HTH domain